MIWLPVMTLAACAGLGGCGSKVAATGADDRMIAAPAEAGPVNLDVQDDLTRRVYTGMHPSWDKNNDGINDCEDDGTCDDSQDYTVARND